MKDYACHNSSTVGDMKISENDTDTIGHDCATTCKSTDHKVSITLLELILWGIVAASVLAELTLIFNEFKPLFVLFGAVIAVVGYVAFYKIRIIYHIDRKKFYPLLFMLILAFFFRFDAEQYIMGGQDQGVYVNMAKYFEDYGHMFPTDKLRESLPDGLKSVYDSQNIIPSVPGKKIAGKYEGYYIPGVYVGNLKHSKYVFQFYHLHPLWMAMFGKLFGPSHGQWSLILFSLLSIILFYMIIEKITNNTFYSFMGGMILAINPLHAYFTKFPVTEVVTFFFSLASFYFLLLYYKSSLNQEKVYRYLILSSLLFGGSFFTHVHGFMYIPFFYALLLAILCGNSPIKKEMIYYIISVMFLYALSVVYGLRFSYPYVHDIYAVSFANMLGKHWNVILGATVILMIAFAFLVNFTKATKSVVNAIIVFIKNNFYVLFYIALLIGIYKIYLLGFTDKYVGDDLWDKRWGIAFSPVNSISCSSLVVLIEHVSLCSFVVFLYGLYKYNKNNIYLNVLTLFMFGFWVYTLIFQYVVPYQYYYARYMLGDMIPSLMLFVVLFMASLNKQKISKIIFVLIICSSIFLMSYQLSNTDSKGANESMENITDIVGKDDILFMPDIAQIKTPLIYYYGTHVLTIDPEQTENMVQFINLFDNENIYALSKFPLHSDYFSFLKIVHINIKTSNVAPKHSPLLCYRTYKETLYLYKVDRNALCDYMQENNGMIYSSGTCVRKLHNFYDDNVWTNGDAYISKLKVINHDYNFLELSTFGFNPYRADLNKLNLMLLLNKSKLNYVIRKGDNYYFQIPHDLKTVNDVEIHSNTFNPLNMHLNNDERDLGIDVKEIKLLKELPK